jgi:hypothetical protein
MLRTLAAPTPQLMAGWPDWLVITVAVIGVVIGIWLLGKLLRLALWLIVVALFVAAILTVVGMLSR